MPTLGQSAAACETVYPFQDELAPHVYFRDNPRNQPDIRSSLTAVDKAVTIAYFGPQDSQDVQLAALWWAIECAVRDATAVATKPRMRCEVIPLIRQSPWTDGASTLARLIFDQNVVAVIGGFDGESTHLAETIVAKAHLPMLSPVATDKTTNLANVPWLFSLVPGDHLIAPALARRIAAMQPRRIAVVMGSDHDSQWFWRELRKWLSELGILFDPVFVLKLNAEDCETPVRRIAATQPECVIVIAPMPLASRVVRAVRKLMPTVLIFGDARLGQIGFLTEMKDKADGIICPYLIGPSNEHRERLVALFEEKFGLPPDYAVLTTYDAVTLLLRAIGELRAEGSKWIDRAELQNRLRAMSPYQGVSGVIEWDSLGANKRRVGTAVISRGRLIPEQD